MDDKIRRRDNLIKSQKQLIGLFDTWVGLVKANDLQGAKDAKELANIVRKQVWKLEDEIKNESKIIKLGLTKLN
jgi:hypothetical protein